MSNKNITGGGISKSSNTSSENKYTSEDLKTMQHWSLDRKIQVTQTRIIEWYERWDGQVYISFSGGKDSTVLLNLVRRIYPDIPAVFIDTGLEYPEIRNFVKTFDNVVWLKSEMNFRKVIETYGYPLISKEVSQKIYEARKCPSGAYAGRFDKDNEYATKYNGRYSMVRWKWLKDSDIPISNRCCNVMKKKPAHIYEKQTGNKPIIATMASESSIRKQRWMKVGCNAFDIKRPISTPMSFWTEQDVLEYLNRYNLPYASVYGEIIHDDNKGYCTTGLDRTGCVFCAYGVHLEKEPNKFQRLKKTHPKLHEYCMKPWSEGGLGMREVLEFIGVKQE